jgi:pimeloyl-ACP methyl ester carboxylesterase
MSAVTANFAFLHGGGQGSWVWQETLAALDLQTSGKFGRALALDAPGCGAKRARSTDGLSLGDVARELVEDIKAAGMDEVVLVGHSQAGQAMALMAELWPALFSRLVYVSCSIPLPGQSVQQMIGPNLRGTHPDEVGWPLDPKTTTMAERYRVMFCNDMDPASADAFLAKLGQDQWPLATYGHSDWRTDHLEALPSTFVICLRDEILPPTWQETFAERFRVERTVRIDAGHQVMNTRPHALAEVLRHEVMLSAY